MGFRSERQALARLMLRAWADGDPQFIEDAETAAAFMWDDDEDRDQYILSYRREQEPVPMGPAVANSGTAD